MSHFPVSVFSDGTKTLEELLAPYQELDGDNLPQEWLEFVDVTDEETDNYNSECVTRVRLPNGAILDTDHISLFREATEDEYLKAQEDNWHFARRSWSDDKYFVRDLESVGGKEIDVPLKELYPTFDEYMTEYANYEKNEDGRYGYWRNPKAKWDWWTVGGRWSGLLRLKAGGTTNSARVKELDLSPDEEEYRNAVKFWEDYIESDPPKNDHVTWYSPNYYKERYLTKENYAKIESEFTTRAVITPDGVWHEKGRMGWWGVSFESGEESLEWDQSFKERFLDSADPDWTLTIVDCHI